MSKRRGIGGRVHVLSKRGVGAPAGAEAAVIGYAPEVGAANPTGGSRSRRSSRRQRNRIDRIEADVLAHRTPPYAVSSGVSNAQTRRSGNTHAVTNAELRAARVLLERSECLPIGPAASVAVAALVQTVDARRIHRDESVLLNITGNGSRLVRRDDSLHGGPVTYGISADGGFGPEIGAPAVSMTGERS